MIAGQSQVNPDLISRIREQVASNRGNLVMLYRIVNYWDTTSGDMHDGSGENHTAHVGIISGPVEKYGIQERAEIGNHYFYAEHGIPTERGIEFDPRFYGGYLILRVAKARAGKIPFALQEFEIRDPPFQAKSKGTCLESISLAFGSEEIAEIIKNEKIMRCLNALRR